jgi:hypothetical protein
LKNRQIFLKEGYGYKKVGKITIRELIGISLRLGWERTSAGRFLNSLTLTDHLVVYPSLRNGGEYLMRNEAALISPLGSGWALRLANIWDRDSDPPPGFEKDDFTTILALQYTF